MRFFLALFTLFVTSSVHAEAPTRELSLTPRDAPARITAPSLAGGLMIVGGLSLTLVGALVEPPSCIDLDENGRAIDCDRDRVRAPLVIAGVTIVGGGVALLGTGIARGRRHRRARRFLREHQVAFAPIVALGQIREAGATFSLVF